MILLKVIDSESFSVPLGLQRTHIHSPGFAKAIVTKISEEQMINTKMTCMSIISLDLEM
jgi:hypothetical protein